MVRELALSLAFARMPRIAAATTRTNEIVVGTMPLVLPYEDLTHSHQFFGEPSASR